MKKVNWLIQLAFAVLFAWTSADALAASGQRDPANADPDHDALPHWLECQLRTNPFRPDTDRDGWTDYLEYAYGSDPLNPAAQPVGYRSAQRSNVSARHR